MIRISFSQSLTCLLISASLVSGYAQAADLHSEGGLDVYEGAEAAWFRYHGMLQLDQAFFIGSAESKGTAFTSGAGLRRADLNLAGSLGPSLSYFLELEYQSPQANQVEIKRLSALYSGLNPSTWLELGQFRTPFGMEATLDEADQTFMEPSLATNLFNADYAQGLRAKTLWGEHVSLEAALYQPRLYLSNSNPALYASSAGAYPQQKGLSARINLSALQDVSKVYLLSLSALHQKVKPNKVLAANMNLPNSFHFYPGLTTRNSQTLIGSDNLLLSNYTQLGIAAAFSTGPLLVQSEYFKSHWTQTSGQKSAPQGWHVQAAFLLDNAERRFDALSGHFLKPVSYDDWGVVELATRWSQIDLANSVLAGGREGNLTLGVNWYLNPHLRVSGNYIRASIHPKNHAARRRITGLGLRLEASW